MYRRLFHTTKLYKVAHTVPAPTWGLIGSALSCKIPLFHVDKTTTSRKYVSKINNILCMDRIWDGRDYEMTGIVIGMTGTIREIEYQRA